VVKLGWKNVSHFLKMAFLDWRRPVPLEYFSDAAAFAQQVQPFLLQHEAENSAPFGIIDRLAHNALPLSAPPILALLRDNQQITAVAVMTPPRNIILPVIEPAAAQQLARGLFADGIAVPGVVAPNQTAEAFADVWCALSSQQVNVHLRERVFELTAVIPPRPASGHFRWAMPADRNLLTEWQMCFEQEAIGIAEPDRAELEEWAEHIVSRTEYHGMGVWEDEGRMVSYAGFGGRAPHGIRVAPVYTPPELRGRGYASACVAALSQALLDSGYQRCFLNTDLANPTSNKIYQAIGYRPMGDALELHFLPTSS
jgi:RimJ/RimL family protein N-acetyltransferase